MSRDLIFLSLENWDDIWRRNQFLCATLARRHPHMKILFVALPKDISNRVRRGRLAGITASTRYTLNDFPNITVLHPYKFLPNTFPPSRLANEFLYRRAIQRTARHLGLRNPLLWINAHWAGHCHGQLNESATIYDITDDWQTSGQAPHVLALIKRQDAALCRAADATIVCSEKLQEIKTPLTQSLHLIPNGVDADHYANVGSATLASAPITRNWPRPVIGYTGTIHPDRVDLHLLAAIAKLLPHATFAMVGPNHIPAAKLATFASNVKFTGPVPYAEIPSYMAAFDVCMTPHVVTPFTESLNPIKLWEYLAAGKPIVSTNVAGFRDYPQYVRIATNSESFVHACREALVEDPACANARRHEAARHSWDSRVDAVEAVIAGVLARRHPEATLV